MGWFRAQFQLLTASVGGYTTNAKALHLCECGKDYYRRGDVDRAFAYFEEAIRLNPTVADCFWWRGSVYKAKEQYDRAIADYSEVIRLDPNGDASKAAGYGRGLNFGSRAEAYLLDGQVERAIADYTEMLRLDPDYWYGYQLRADAYEANSEHERALADRKKAKELEEEWQRVCEELESAVARGIRRSFSIEDVERFRREKREREGRRLRRECNISMSGDG